MSAETLCYDARMKDGGQRIRVHIPGCMGCAARGHDYCTCWEPNARDRREAAFAALEERVERLERIVTRRTSAHPGTSEEGK